MCDLTIQSLRRLVLLLLLTVFITESAYANVMMVAHDVNELSHVVSRVLPTQDEAVAAHCHEQTHPSRSTGKPHANGHLCSHCLACFSVILPAQPSVIPLPKQNVMTISFVEVYHSPICAQPQKPPIV